MPFCSKCGAQIVAGDKFCDSCGSPVEVTATAPVNAPAYAPVPSVEQLESVRQASIIEVDKLIQYFGQKKPQYDEYDDCCKKFSYYSNPRSSVVVSSGSGRLLLIFGLILTIGGGTFSFYSIVVILALIQTLSKGDTLTSGELEIIIVFMIPLFALIAGIVLLILRGKKRRAYAGKVQSKREEILAYYAERCVALANELTTHFLNYGSCPVEAAYTNPGVLMLIRGPLIVGRAYTINDAINVMIFDSNRSGMDMQALLAARSAPCLARGTNSAAFFTETDFISYYPAN